MKTKKRVVRNRVTLVNGGATAPTIELYQLESGHCRLWSYLFDQEGHQSETIQTFRESDWEAAVKRAKDVINEQLTTA